MSGNPFETSTSVAYDPFVGKCGSCRWFSYPNCRRHAPAVAVNHIDPANPNYAIGQAIFPQMDHYGWCGDYEKKP